MVSRSHYCPLSHFISPTLLKGTLRIDVRRGPLLESFIEALLISKMFGISRLRLGILLATMSALARVSSVPVEGDCHREPYLVLATYNFGAWHDPKFVELIRPKQQGCNLVMQTTATRVSTVATYALTSA